MGTAHWNAIGLRRLRSGLLGLLVGVAAMTHAAAADAPAKATQRTFATPEQAAQALIDAAKSNKRNAVLSVLGPDASSWISSGDAVADKESVQRFVDAWDAKHEIRKEGDDKATLTLGQDDFPFAFPVVRKGGQWRFDTAAGKEEMLARRIGDNELSTIKVLQAIVDAQMDYASQDRNGDGVLAYAQKLRSSPGKHDGLYWPAKAGEPESPLGDLLARASNEGYAKGNEGQTPYHGYYFRLLKGQGKNAASGPLDYVVHGRAIGGFAVIAWPARYANSGVMTFMVNQDGKVYQADLGPNTAKRAELLTVFDPGPDWKPVSTP